MSFWKRSAAQGPAAPAGPPPGSPGPAGPQGSPPGAGSPPAYRPNLGGSAGWPGAGFGATGVSFGAVGSPGMAPPRSVPEAEDDRECGRVPLPGVGVVRVFAYAVDRGQASEPRVDANLLSEHPEAAARRADFPVLVRTASWAGADLSSQQADSELFSARASGLLGRDGDGGSLEALLAVLGSARRRAVRQAVALVLQAVAGPLSREDALSAFDESVVRSVQET